MPSAGHIVAGESPIEGAIRETYEEFKRLFYSDEFVN